jgi:hypothetical protein
MKDVSSDLNLTPEQKAVNFETMRHIEAVRNFIGLIQAKLILRAQSSGTPPTAATSTRNTWRP